MIIDPRPEGVYCSWLDDESIVIGGRPFRQLKIERVNGDGSVSIFICCDIPQEAGVIKEFLSAREGGEK